MNERIKRAIAERETDKLPALGFKARAISPDLCGRVNHLILSTTTSVALTYRMQIPYHEFRILYIQPSDNVGFYIAKCSNFGELTYVEIGSGCSIDLEFIECFPVKGAALVRINALIDPKWSNMKLFYNSKHHAYPLRVHNLRHAPNQGRLHVEVDDIIEGTFMLELDAFMLRLDLRFA